MVGTINSYKIVADIQYKISSNQSFNYLFKWFIFNSFLENIQSKNFTNFLNNMLFLYNELYLYILDFEFDKIENSFHI